MSELKYDVAKFVDEEFELSVNVSPKEETVWLSLDEMSALFERDRSVIGKHIRKIYQEGELDKNRTWAKNARHLEDGRIFQVDVYNLDVQTISKDTKTYEPLIKDEPEVIETKKEEKKDTYESISLFDFIDDD